MIQWNSSRPADRGGRSTSTAIDPRRRRTWVGGAFRPAAVVVAGRAHRRRPRRPRACAGRRRRHCARRRGAAARPRRLARARQRARPHRVGGLPIGDARRGGRRRHDARRHAAQLAAADDDAPRRSAIKRAAAAPRQSVDVGFWGGAVPENLGALAPLHAAGRLRLQVLPLAARASTSSRTWTARSCAPRMEEIAALGSRLIVHAEDPALLHDGGRARPRLRRRSSRRARRRARRPPIDAVIDAARRTGARAHILHLSDAHSLPAIRAAKAEGVALTVETCPHYLTIAAEEVPDGASAFKCCPPIREAANRDLLWEGVVDGTIDAIVSDHSPCTVDLKRSGGGDFGLAWGGIAGLQVGLSAVWTEARGARHPAGDAPAAVHDRARAVAGLARCRRHRARRARPTSPCSALDDPLRDRCAAAAAQEPHHRLRPPRAHRPHPSNVAARQGDVQRHRGRRRRGAAVPRQAPRPAAVRADAQPERDDAPSHARETRMQLDGAMPPRLGRSCSPATGAAARRPLPALHARHRAVGPAPVRDGRRGAAHRVGRERHDRHRQPRGHARRPGQGPARLLRRPRRAARAACCDDASRSPAIRLARPRPSTARTSSPARSTSSGAQPGDLLRITVETLVPRVPYGVISNRHGKGALARRAAARRATTSASSRPSHERDGVLRRHACRSSTAATRVVAFPLAPFLGMMGVAVAGDERPHSVPPGPHGGNIDINLLVEGTSLYLPVQVAGGAGLRRRPALRAGRRRGRAHRARGVPARDRCASTWSRGRGARASSARSPGRSCARREYLVPTGLDPDLDEAMRSCVRAALALLRARWGMDEHLAYAYLERRDRLRHLAGRRHRLRACTRASARPTSREWLDADGHANRRFDGQESHGSSDRAIPRRPATSGAVTERRR